METISINSRIEKVICIAITSEFSNRKRYYTKEKVLHRKRYATDWIGAEL